MPDRPSRIVLTGFSGTGKSLVAPLIAQRLGWELVDTDALVEQAAGRPIADIFARDGEARFRDLEADAVRQACARQNAVVAVGSYPRPTFMKTSSPAPVPAGPGGPCGPVSPIGPIGPVSPCGPAGP